MPAPKRVQCCTVLCGVMQCSGRCSDSMGVHLSLSGPRRGRLRSRNVCIITAKRACSRHGGKMLCGVRCGVVAADVAQILWVYISVCQAPRRGRLRSRNVCIITAKGACVVARCNAMCEVDSVALRFYGCTFKSIRPPEGAAQHEECVSNHRATCSVCNVQPYSPRTPRSSPANRS